MPGRQLRREREVHSSLGQGQGGKTDLTSAGEEGARKMGTARASPSGGGQGHEVAASPEFLL